MSFEEVRPAFTRIEEFVRVGSTLAVEEKAQQRPPTSAKNAHSYATNQESEYGDYQSISIVPEERALRPSNSNFPSSHIINQLKPLRQAKSGSENKQKPANPEYSKESEIGGISSIGPRLGRLRSQKENSPSKNHF